MSGWLEIKKKGNQRKDEKEAMYLSKSIFLAVPSRPSSYPQAFVLACGTCMNEWMVWLKENKKQGKERLRYLCECE